MVQLQVLNKILDSGNASLFTLNNLDDSYFSDYKDEFNFSLILLKVSIKFLLFLSSAKLSKRYLSVSFTTIKSNELNFDTKVVLSGTTPYFW